MKKLYIIKDPKICNDFNCEYQEILFKTEKTLKGLKEANKKLKELQKKFNEPLKIEIANEKL